MFRKISLALLAGAPCMGAGLHQAAAIELAPPAEPAVIYATQPARQPAPPVRTADAERGEPIFEPHVGRSFASLKPSAGFSENVD